MGKLRIHFELIGAIRQFFAQEGFLETITPPMVPNPGMEPHIHPFQVYSAHHKKTLPLYLHTSPEFLLKELLTKYQEEGWDKLYSLSYCFRDEPVSPIHRPQFLMLEWYRVHQRYEKILKDCQQLVMFIKEQLTDQLHPEVINASFEVMTMQELVFKYTQIDILDYLDSKKLHQKLQAVGDIPLPASELSWDDYFFLLFLNKVEPRLIHHPLLIVTEFPAPLAALSTIKSNNPKVCERFEMYIRGIEICNCYNELTDAHEQRRRFQEQAEMKQSLYGYKLPEPDRFLTALEKGLPPCAGVAMGVERLLHALTGRDGIFFD